MKVLVTGADGFIGRNLALAIREQPGWSLLTAVRATTPGELEDALAAADAVVHLAGANRPPDAADFQAVNVDFTHRLCAALEASSRPLPVFFASSIQAGNATPYGASKAAAERRLRDYAQQTGASVAIARLPNVFGKWCRPDYNSVVATFCHRLARGEAIAVDDAAAPLRLVYIDDVVAAILGWLRAPWMACEAFPVEPVYVTTVGELAQTLHAFARVRETLQCDAVGAGFLRALYATWLSHLPSEAFSYPLAASTDRRGTFVEFLKTKDAGQVSYFTAAVGMTRGGHYHHTKNEKFLVVKGRARFRFRHLVTDEHLEVVTDEREPRVVDTIPGWSHDVTNIGDEPLVVLLWANERFDRARPDTHASEV